MNTVNIWSEQLAKAVTPDEVDLAPIMADAFLRGGADRKALFQRTKGGMLGAFNPVDSLIIFPLLLQAITTAASVLNAILTSGEINNFLSLLKDLLSIRESLKPKEKIGIPLDQVYKPLQQAMTTISSALEASGLSQDQRDLITYRTIKVLLEDPHGTLFFLQEANKRK